VELFRVEASAQRLRDIGHPRRKMEAGHGGRVHRSQIYLKRPGNRDDGRWREVLRTVEEAGMEMKDFNHSFILQILTKHYTCTRLTGTDTIAVHIHCQFNIPTHTC
jgi:hypothetical protein